MTGEFLDYYESIPDASLVFGLPITEVFVTNHPAGMTVQYFQRVRFELHPTQATGKRVQLTPLGRLLYEPGAESVNPYVYGACRSFVTGYSVCYDFLTFFDAHGGLERFGNPISGFEFQQDGLILQHFERARFEWHTELPRGQEIVLAGLGGIYFYRVGEDPNRIPKAAPVSLSILPPVQTALSLRISVFVAKAMTLSSDSQTVYVIVQDQTLSPVSGATGSVTIHVPGSDDLAYPLTTDPNGIAIVDGITFRNLQPNTSIPVVVTITHAGLKDSATTSFRIWR